MLDKEKREIYTKWKSLVNMSKSELQKFYDSPEGKVAGLTASEARKQGIDSGRESARWIMKMKDTPVEKWTANMWKWAKKQISFISRMFGMKGDLYDEKGKKTRKHTSLLIWGHDPKKYASGGRVSRSRISVPNVRGGWTKEKIRRYLQANPSDTSSTYTLAKYISEFDNWEDFKKHIYYHGTPNYIEKGLKPSIVFSEKFAEQSGGGGYGERYWGISLTKRKRTAESFSGMSRSVTIYPVILKRDAVVIERTDLSDASEIEDIIVELYEQGVDAVWIGGGEEELVLINPNAAILYKSGSDTYQIFGGYKSVALTDEQIKSMYENSKKIWDEYEPKFKAAKTKDEREALLRSIPAFKFKEGGEVKETMKFWHGGNLDEYNDIIAQKAGRYEYGVGLYLTNELRVAMKYAKGSRKLYLVEVEKGLDISDAKLPLAKFHDFINSHVIASKRKEVKERLEKHVKDGLVSAYIFNNIILNEKAIKSTNTYKLREFFVDNGIDYEIVDNAFGWGESMMVLYNMKKIVKKEVYKYSDALNINLRNEGETKMAKGGTTELLAPNGEPSKLIPEQYKLVRTPEFKAWFGLWEEEYILNQISNPNTAIEFINNLLPIKNDFVFNLPLVQRLMLTLTKNDKVFGSIVSLIPIDVVNGIAGKKFPSNEVGSNLSMFRDALYRPISNEFIHSLTFICTSLATKLGDFFDTRSNHISIPTELTNNLTLFDLGALSAFHGFANLYGSNGDIELSGAISAAKSSFPKRLGDKNFFAELTSLFYKYLFSSHDINCFDKNNKTLLVSQIKDENGEPLVVYHGTTHGFNEFTKDRSNVENHYGKGYYFTDSFLDVTKNYLESGTDLTNRIQLMAERFMSNEDMPEKKAKKLAESMLKGKDKKVLHVFLDFKNPIIVTNDGSGTYYDPIENYDEETEEYTENEDSLPMQLYNAMQNVQHEFSNVDAQDIWNELSEKVYFADSPSAFEVDSALRECESVVFIEDEEGNLAGNEFIRSVYEQMGFDGIIMDADLAFGHKRKIGKKMEMDYGTKHYIAFQSEQIKLADGTNTTFDASNPDIRYADGGEVSEREPLYVDQYGKQIVYDDGLYFIAVNNIEKADYITLWKHGVRGKIGLLDADLSYLVPKPYSEKGKFLSVKLIEIDKPHRGKGLSKKMYKALLKYSDKDVVGILSYLPQRSNTKQVPKVYSSFKSHIDGDYQFILKEENIGKFKTGGMIAELKQPKTISEIAEMHNVPLEQLKKQLIAGIKVEMEHTKDPKIARTIALHHLWESPEYYKLLSDMEQKFEEGGQTDFNPDNKQLKSIIEHKSGDAGGMLVGKRHSEGGIKATNKSTGQPLEMEGGEVVVTRKAVADDTKREFEGEMLTNRQILSRINQSGGGVAFADGGEVPDAINVIGRKYKIGGETVKDSDFVNSCGCKFKMADGGATDFRNIIKGKRNDNAGSTGQVSQAYAKYAGGGRMMEGDMYYAGGGIIKSIKKYSDSTISESRYNFEESRQEYGFIVELEDGRIWTGYATDRANAKQLAKEHFGIRDGKLKLEDIPKSVKRFMPKMQQLAIVGSEEHWDVIDRLEDIIKRMPKTYGTKNQSADDKIVYLHYFYGQSDWYIVEKDKIEEDQQQAFGYTILNGDIDMSEWGYISIEEIKSTNKIELDFYFEPIRFGDLKKEWESEDEKNEVSETEQTEKPLSIEDEIAEIYKNAPNVQSVYTIGDSKNKDLLVIEQNKGKYYVYIVFKRAIFDGKDFDAIDSSVIEWLQDVFRKMNGNVPTEYELFEMIHFRYGQNLLEKYRTGDWQTRGEIRDKITELKTQEVLKNGMPDYLFIGGYPNATVYSDKTIEDKQTRDYHQIARVIYSPLEFKVYDNNPKYKEALEIASKEYQELYEKKFGVNPYTNKGENVQIDIMKEEAMKHGNKSLEAIDTKELLETVSEPEYIEDTEPISKPLSIEEAHELADKNISEAQKKYNDAVLAKAAYVQENGYPVGGNKEYDKLVYKTREAEQILEQLKKAKEYLLPLTSNEENKIVSETIQPEIPASKQHKNMMERFKNASQVTINNEIRALIAQKGLYKERYSADELSFISLYEGGGAEKKTTADKSILTQFFTPEDIVSRMWGLAIKHGFNFNGTSILEPSFGSGRFFKYIPKDANVTVTGYEIEPTTYKIGQLLYGFNDNRYNLYFGSFETIFFKGRRHVSMSGVSQLYDLVITNPPYGDYVSEYAPLGEKSATGAFTWEMYFIMRGIDLLKKGGLLIYIIPNTFISNDNKYNDFKEKLAKKCELLEGYRLPNGVFGFTEVGTDIIVLRKK